MVSAETNYAITLGYIFRLWGRTGSICKTGSINIIISQHENRKIKL